MHPETASVAASVTRENRLAMLDLRGYGALRGSAVRRSLEADVHAKGTHHGRVHGLEAVIGAQFLAEGGFHHLEIDGEVEPRGEHGVVVHLDRVLDVEAEV